MLKRTALLLLSAILILAVVLTSCKGNGIAESETD